jgi:hypothetical protein
MATPGDRKTLEIYLNDHLAGARSALDLLEDIAGDDVEEGFATFVRELHEEISTDREQLQTIIDRLGVPPERFKQLLADLSETMGRVKLARAGAPDALSRLLELETLSAGIWTKMRLWRSLAAADVLGDGFSDIDLDALHARGQRQLDAVEEQRLRAARAALAG